MGMTSFPCPGCGKVLKVKDEAAGKRLRCPGCGQTVRVPGGTPASQVTPRAPTRGESTPGREARGAGTPHQESATEPTAETASGPGSFEPQTRTELTAFLAPPQAPDELGRLGPYRVLQVLGAGGMGVVFQAEDVQLQRPVALKALLPALAASTTAHQRFLREARSAAAIDHDHIVHIYQVGEDRGVPFLAMQFLQGEPLDQRLKRERKPPLAEVLRIGRETAEGLAAAHAKGLIHRDIKPANLWLEGERGCVKILDFGLARAAGGEGHLTQTGAIVGTPAYMAPEQARGGGVDARCDLFSLGCVLYRLCTGVPAFTGPDTISTLMAVATEEPRPPHEAAGVPQPLSQLVMRLLAKRPEDRPASAREVADALETMQKGSRAATPAPPTPKPKARKARPAPVRQAAGPGPRLALLLGGVALGVILLLTGGFFLFRALTSSGKDEDTAAVKTTRPEEPPPVRQAELPTGMGAQPPTGAKVLFNGSNGRGQDDWMRIDGLPADWPLLSDGSLEVGRTNLRTREQFGPDYQLHVEFWVPYMFQAKGQARGNSGVFLQGRFEIQILDSYGKTQPDARDCGALYGAIAPSWNACKPPEQWQVFDITFRTPRPERPGRLTVFHNGIRIIDDATFDKVSGMALPGAPGDPGPIVLQSHGAKVRFRNLWLAPLTPREGGARYAPVGFVPLFNGKDLTGWRTHPAQPYGWSVEDGLLTGRADRGDTHLFSERGDFANFHLRAEVKVNAGGNSGIFFRTPFSLAQYDRWPGGYEAQILHRYERPTYLTGSLQGLVKAPHPDLGPGEWFLLEILAVDNDLTVKVNGQMTAHYVDLKRAAPRGHLALQAMEPRTTVVQFRLIEIQELPPNP
jgi:serine/threonine protein kinase